MTMNNIRLFTIGFTKKDAEQFFRLLQDSGVKRLIDIRLGNVSQLAGFAQGKNLAYFLKAIAQIEYLHEPLLAPTREILDAFKKNKGSWEAYERDFLRLLVQRKVEEVIPLSRLDQAVLLCSEDTPEHCHRRLVAEYFRSKFPQIEIIHLI